MSSLELKFFNSGVFKEYSNEIKRIYRFENSNYLVTQLIFNSRVLKKKTIKTPWPSYFFLTGEVQTTFLSTDFIDTSVTRWFPLKLNTNVNGATCILLKRPLIHLCYIQLRSLSFELRRIKKPAMFIDDISNKIERRLFYFLRQRVLKLNNLEEISVISRHSNAVSQISSYKWIRLVKHSKSTNS